MTMKYFLHYWSFANPSVAGGFPTQVVCEAELDFFDVNMNELLKKQSSCQQFKTYDTSL